MPGHDDLMPGKRTYGNSPVAIRRQVRTRFAKLTPPHRGPSRSRKNVMIESRGNVRFAVRLRERCLLWRTNGAQCALALGTGFNNKVRWSGDGGREGATGLDICPHCFRSEIHGWTTRQSRIQLGNCRRGQGSVRTESRRARRRALRATAAGVRDGAVDGRET